MLLFLFIAILFIFFSAQPFLLLCSFIILFIIFKLFWKSKEPKVIFFALFLFWLSIVIKIFYADIVGVSYEGLSLSPLISETTFIALLSLLVFSLGLYITSRNI